MKDDDKMKEAFMLDDLEHVFQPKDDINKMWELWKKQFFKEMKLFTSHNMHTLGKPNITADRHGSTTTFAASCVQKPPLQKGMYMFIEIANALAPGSS